MQRFALTLYAAICAIILFAAFPAHAGLSTDAVSQAGFSKLTPAQQAEILQQVAVVVLS